MEKINKIIIIRKKISNTENFTGELGTQTDVYTCSMLHFIIHYSCFRGKIRHIANGNSASNNFNKLYNIHNWKMREKTLKKMGTSYDAMAQIRVILGHSVKLEIAF